MSPYTRDVLYRNGTIDYVPYDLMMPMAPVAQMQAMPPSYPIQRGPLTYGNDSFTRTNMQSPSVALNVLGMADDYNTQAAEITNYRNSLKKGSENNVSIYKNKKTFIKGLISAGVLIGTVVLLIKGRKTASKNTECKSLLEKLNPVNWFKK